MARSRSIRTSDAHDEVKMCDADAIQPSPSHFSAGCGISLVGLFATLCYHSHKTRQMRSTTSFSTKRILYRLITSLAPTICMLNFLAVTSPPMHRFAALVQHIVVAGVMAASI